MVLCRNHVYLKQLSKFGKKLSFRPVKSEKKIIKKIHSTNNFGGWFVWVAEVVY